MKKIEITQDVINEAKRNKNGWVYAIDGKFLPHQAIPPHAIAGAWKVDAYGLITGEFEPNPKYIPSTI
ncbi:hypothetical protein ACO0LM_27875 [Undibacterium sp. Di26W]|uniref:hypothetical protein n=1 Tax=Undibacterium sp. Di26W TaxID=3413035 RepID=UPI003BF0B3F1